MPAHIYHHLYDWSGSAHVQGLHCHACAVLTSCYLPGHKCFGRWQLDGVLFLSYNLRFLMGGVNGLWAISPGLSVTSTREVKGQGLPYVLIGEIAVCRDCFRGDRNRHNVQVSELPENIRSPVEIF